MKTPTQEVDTHAKKATKKKAKSPTYTGKPRRPCTSYNIFFGIERKKIVREQQHAQTLQNGDMHIKVPRGKESARRNKQAHVGFANLAHMVAQRWKNVDETLKMKLEELAKLDRLRYKKELQVWGSKAKGGSSKADTKLDSNFDGVLKRIEDMRREVARMQDEDALVETPEDAFTSELNSNTFPDNDVAKMGRTSDEFVSASRDINEALALFRSSTGTSRSNTASRSLSSPSPTNESFGGDFKPLPFQEPFCAPCGTHTQSSSTNNFAVTSRSPFDNPRRELDTSSFNFESPLFVGNVAAAESEVPKYCTPCNPTFALAPRSNGTSMSQDHPLQNVYSRRGSVPLFASGSRSFPVESSAIPSYVGSGGFCPSVHYPMLARRSGMPFMSPAGGFYPMTQGVLRNTAFPSSMGFEGFNFGYQPVQCNEPSLEDMQQFFGIEPDLQETKPFLRHASY